MRIEITSTQAGASQGLALRSRTLRTRVQRPALSGLRTGAPVEASSLRVDSSKSSPFSKNSPFSKGSPFSASCATPVPVRWDAVRG